MGNFSPAERAQVKVKLHVMAERVDFTLRECNYKLWDALCDCCYAGDKEEEDGSDADAVVSEETFHHAQRELAQICDCN